MFPDLKCGTEDFATTLGPGATLYGDVWVPMLSYYKIKLAGKSGVLILCDYCDVLLEKDTC